MQIRNVIDELQAFNRSVARTEIVAANAQAAAHAGIDTASGSPLLASPGSLSRASWKRNSFTKFLVNVDVTVPDSVSLLTRLSPE